jgi:hypothetical protein
MTALSTRFHSFEAFEKLAQAARETDDVAY